MYKFKLRYQANILRFGIAPKNFCLAIALSHIVLLTLQSTVIAEVNIKQQSSWKNIIKRILAPQEPKDVENPNSRGSRVNKEPLDKGRGRLGGSRGDTICLITPGKNEKIWHLNPTFIWKGNLAAVGIRRSKDKLALWRHSVPEKKDFQITSYKGLPLQFGESYDWLFFTSVNSLAPSRRISFTVMDSLERISITDEIAVLEKKLNNQKVSEEIIALHKAEYFSQKKLWGDVLIEMYSVKNPSQELRTNLNRITQRICGKSSR